jgi:nucleotide-binding universal stress UspA family protein
MNAQEKDGAGRFEKILVAVDYSSATPEIFTKALELAKAYGSSLLVFHCLQRQFSTMPDASAYAGIGGYRGVYSEEVVELEEQLIAEAIEELLAWLTSFVRQAKDKGVPAEADYAVGEPGRKICEAAENCGADLIVIGRRGRTALSELLLGSTSNYILHHAHCSVLVIQH